jgi:glyoxylase-like metal-dependent hydrolase (beta-lactamase superfamily II)
MLFVPALQAQNQVPMTAVPVAGPVYMLQGPDGGNIGVITDTSGSILIDSMMQRSAGQIRAAIKDLPGGNNVRFLINTHWHSDHTDGNKALGPGSTIVAHENVRSLLSKPQALMGQQTPALPVGAIPAVTYSDALTLYAGHEPIRLVHYSHAHTDGDTVVYIDGAKVVHMGDMFFNGMFPFLDVANGGDIDNWVRQLDAIMAKLPADTKIIPGHGPLAGVAELKSFRQMLFDSAEIVRKQMKEGKTVEQIKGTGLPERFSPWTKGFLPTSQWLELVYRSLERVGIIRQPIAHGSKGPNIVLRRSHDLHTTSLPFCPGIPGGTCTRRCERHQQTQYTSERSHPLPVPSRKMSQLHSSLFAEFT